MKTRSKILFVLFSICSVFLVLGQENDSIMRYSFLATIPILQDSLGAQNVQEIVYLDVFENQSRFASEVNIFREEVFNGVDLSLNSSDSELRKASELANSRSTEMNYRVYREGEQLNTYLQLAFTDYRIKQDVDFIVWAIDPLITTLNQMKVQKATGTLGGREWEVYFTKDIALQEGPYKFKNLPGFVIKAQTKDGLFSFELLKSEKVFNSYWLPQSHSHAVEVDSGKWDKVKRITAKKTYGQLIDENGLTNYIFGRDGEPLSDQERNQKFPIYQIPIELD